MAIELPRGDELHKPGDILDVNSSINIEIQDDSEITQRQNTLQAHKDGGGSREGALASLDSLGFAQNAEYRDTMSDINKIYGSTEEIDEEDKELTEEEKDAIMYPEDPEEPEEPIPGTVNAEHITRAAVPIDPMEVDEEVDWGTFDLTAATEKSATARAFKYFEKINDPYYEGPETLESVEASIAEANIEGAQITEEFQGTPMYDELMQDQFEYVQDLVAQKEALKFRDIQEQAADDLSLGDMWEYVSTHKEKAAFDILQGMVAEPDLLVASALVGAAAGSAVPVLGNAVGGAVGTVLGLGTRAVTVGRAVKMAMIPVSQLSGAYVGGRLEGAFSRALDQAALDGDFDFAKGWEKAHVDGLLGATFVGVGGVLVKGGKALKGPKKDVEDFEDFVDSTDELNFDLAKSKFNKDRATTDIQARVDKVLALEEGVPYVDVKGNIKMFVPKVSENPAVDLARVLELTPKTKSKLSTKKVEALTNGIMEAEDTVNNLTGRMADIRKIMDDEPEFIDGAKLPTKYLKLKEELGTAEKGLKGMNKRLARHDEAISAYNELYSYDQPLELDTPKTFSIPNANGESVMFTKYDPEVHANGKIRIDGFNPDDFIYTSQGTGKTNAFTGAVTKLLGRAMAPVEDLLPDSATLRLLRSKLDVDPTKPNSPMWTLQEDIRYKQAQVSREYKDILESIDNKVLTDSNDGAGDLVKQLRNPEHSQDPLIIEAAVKIKALLQTNAAYMKESGINMATLDDYLPRVMDKTELRTPEGSKAYSQMLIAEQGRTSAEATDTIKKILLDIEERDGVLTTKSGSLNKTPYGERTLNQISDAQLESQGLLSPDLLNDISKNLMGGIKRAELAKLYGDGGSKLDPLLKQIEAELKEKGATMTDAQKNNFFDVYNSFNGSHGRIESESIHNVQDTLLTISNVTSLGLAGITSTVEPLLNIARMNSTGMIKGMGKVAGLYVKAPVVAVKELAQFGAIKLLPKDNFVAKILKDIPEDEATKSARDIGLTMDISLEETLDAIQGSSMNAGALKTVNKAFFLANGLHWVTKLSRSSSMKMGTADILDNIGKLSNDLGNKTRKEWLMEVNLNPKDALSWAKAGADTKHPYYTEILRASARMADEVVAHPTAGNRPTWMSNHRYKLMSQFKSYAVAYTNTILKRQWANIEKAKKNGGSPAMIQQMVKASTSAAILYSGYYYMGMGKESLRNGFQPVNRNDDEEQVAMMRAGISMSGSASLIEPIAQALARRNTVEAVASSLAPAPTKVLKAAGQIVTGDVGRGVVSLTPGLAQADVKTRKKAAKKIDKALK